MPRGNPPYTKPWLRPNWFNTSMNRGRKLYAIQEWQAWRALRGLEFQRIPPWICRQVRIPEDYMSRKALGIFERLYNDRRVTVISESETETDEDVPNTPDGNQHRQPTTIPTPSHRPVGPTASDSEDEFHGFSDTAATPEDRRSVQLDSSGDSPFRGFDNIDLPEPRLFNDEWNLTFNPTGEGLPNYDDVQFRQPTTEDRLEHLHSMRDEEGRFRPRVFEELMHMLGFDNVCFHTCSKPIHMVVDIDKLH